MSEASDTFSGEALTMLLVFDHTKPRFICTIAQQAAVCRLRVTHPRCRVVIPVKQEDAPRLRVWLRWPSRSLYVWLAPDGSRVQGCSCGAPDPCPPSRFGAGVHVPREAWAHAA